MSTLAVLELLCRANAAVHGRRADRLGDGAEDFVGAKLALFICNLFACELPSVAALAGRGADAADLPRSALQTLAVVRRGVIPGLAGDTEAAAGTPSSQLKQPSMLDAPAEYFPDGQGMSVSLLAW